MDIPDSISDKLEPLRQRLRERPDSVLPFVGSGLSLPPERLPVEQRLPSWSEMLVELRRQVTDPSFGASIDKKIAQGDLLCAASALAHHLQRAPISRYIEERFLDPRFLRPSVYGAVASLPCLRFATTNYDPWLRQALQDSPHPARMHVEEINPEQRERQDTFRQRHTPFVFHAHYDARDASKCVFTQADFDFLLHETKGYREFLSALLADHCFLFLGYSVGDPDLRYLLASWRRIAGSGTATRHYLLDVDIDPADAVVLRQRGIEPIDYATEHRYELLEPLIRSLLPAPVPKGIPASPVPSPPGSKVAADGICPYPGLAAFREDQAAYFCGREGETLEVLRRVRAPAAGTVPWLQIEGASGAGKSSLARAGLLPELRRERQDDEVPVWRIAIMRPGREPLRELAFALCKALDRPGLSTEVIEHDLRAYPRRVASLLREQLDTDQRLLLLIDQFEEAFTSSDPDQDRGEPELTLFSERLAAALLDPSAPLHLVTTIRRDFQGQFVRVPALDELLNRAERFNLPPMALQPEGEPGGLLAAVSEPARRAGLAWSDDDLPRRIASDAARERNALPLLAYCLHELWSRRTDGVLSARVYDAELGGVGRAFTRGADELLARLDRLESDGRKWRDRALDLLCALVHTGRGTGDTRRRVAKQTAIDQAGGGSIGQDVYLALSGGRPAGWDGRWDDAPRLVVASGEEGEGSKAFVEIAHESLIASWDPLRKRIDAQRNEFENRDRLGDAARRWEAAGRPGETGVSQADFEGFQQAERLCGPEVRPFVQAVAEERAGIELDNELATVLVTHEQPFHLAYCDELAMRMARALASLQPREALLTAQAAVGARFQRDRQRYGERLAMLSRKQLAPGERYKLDAAEEVVRRAEVVALLFEGVLTRAAQHLELVSREIETHRAELELGWARVLESIATGETHPAYGRQPVVPRFDLLPLRLRPSDVPEERVWEFLQLGTGARPLLDQKRAEWRIGPDTGMVFVLIPGGSFQMGSRENEQQGDEYPAHSVALSPFYLSAHTCTVGQFQRGADRVSSSEPAAEVSWERALAFCASRGVALPTEAQWEYACRAGTTTRWWCGNDEKELGRGAWYGNYSRNAVHAVGEKDPNPWGLFDVHGNVWEWCRDWFGPYSEDARRDPTGPRSGSDRVMRGGSYWDGADGCRSACRNWFDPADRSRNVGFRVAFPAASEVGR